jgi:hypothetical protein
LEKEKEELKEEVLALREKQHDYRQELRVVQAVKVRKVSELNCKVCYLTFTASLAQSYPHDAN